MTDYDYPEHYADNIWDAIELAENLKASGDYDLFRGQSENFPIVPSVLREGVDRTSAEQDLSDFANWVHQTPDLKSLHGDPNAILAVAQHYSIKTPFLDFSFSPQVAGFFATDGATVGKTGTIICLNRKRFIDSWEDMNQRYQKEENRPLTEIVEINVQNLWRLQAQQGAFLRCHVEPGLLEMFSFFLHIYFPQERDPEILPPQQIYPEEKSHLEVLLDQYFLIASYPERERQMEEIFGTKITISEDVVEREVKSYFIDNELPPTHSSWTDFSFRSWLKEPDEKYTQMANQRVEALTLPEGKYSPQLEREIEDRISGAIEQSESETRDNIDWQIYFSSGDSVFIDGEGVSNSKDEWTSFSMSEMLNAIYAGMRYLPYSNAQVSRSLTRYVIMTVYGVYQTTENTEGIEFSGGGVRGRGFCDRSALLQAIRPDFFSFVKPEKLDAHGKLDFRETIFAASTVKSAYIFDQLIDLFVEDIIPSQACVAVEDLVIGVNPARIEVLGES